MRLALLFCAGLCLGPAACRDAEPGPPPEAAMDSAICEHDLQRSICAKCNPALIPVFQAKGDWCEEHGFSESSCPICHPEKRGKLLIDLSKKEEKQEPPEDGTKVRLKTKETARLAGIETAQAIEHEANARLSTTATIVYDATKYAQINARASGVVRELKVDLGALVEPKTALAVIQSASVGADRSRLKGASAALGIAKANYDRVKALVEQGLSAKSDLWAAQAELEAAQADYAEKAATLGEIDRGAQGVGGYTMTSPISGMVIRRSLSLGQLVSTDEILFEVADTSSMWAELDIPETDVALVSLGQEVAVQVEGLSGREFRGKISYIAPEVDRQTRTIKARAALQNPDGVLRANLFATALLLGEQRSAVMVPRAAVQKARGVELVFVRLADDLYEARYVTLLPDTGEGELIGVKVGLKAGEEVVTQGSFLLKTETLKDSIGAGCCAGD